MLMHGLFTNAFARVSWNLARQEPQRWVTIDAGQPADKVQKAIRQEVARRLGILQ